MLAVLRSLLSPLILMPLQSVLSLSYLVYDYFIRQLSLAVRCDRFA
jgi:hypothetical protein